MISQSSNASASIHSNSDCLPPGKKQKISIKLRHSAVALSAKANGSKTKNLGKISCKIFSTSETTVELKNQPEKTYCSIDENLADDCDLLNAMPCDALLAMRSLVQRNQHAVVGSHNVPFVLRKMIHAVMVGNDKLDVGASTTIGQELDDLLQRGVIRMLRLFTSTDKGGNPQDVAVFEESIFRAEVERTFFHCDVEKEEEDKLDEKKNGRSILIDWPALTRRFLFALEAIRKMYVKEIDLINTMSSFPSDMNSNIYKAMHSKKDIDALVLAGLLIPMRPTHSFSLSAEDNIYYFTLPGMGEACQSIINGRKDMILKVKRSLQKEMKQTALARKPLRNSSFSPLFHLKDLISTGHLVLTQTPSGVSVKLGSAASSL